MRRSGWEVSPPGHQAGIQAKALVEVGTVAQGLGSSDTDQLSRVHLELRPHLSVLDVYV